MNPSTEPRSSRAASSRLLRLSLLLILGWSFLLRVWFGSVDLHGGRFWDERFGFDNIHGLLAEGELKPNNGFHPSLSYLPQAALLAASDKLHQWTGNPRFAIFLDREGYFPGQRAFSPTAYLLCRFSQSVLGVLSLWLTFLLGRRLFSPEVGVLATLLLAVVPWHIRQSVIYKPDILLLVGCLVALYWTLQAAAEPTRRRYLIAGLGIGLAMASKFNAAPVAVPLMVSTVLLARGDRRLLWWLVLAGATASAVILLFNPWLAVDPSLYVDDFSRTLRDYANKGAAHDSSHLYVAWHGVLSLVSTSFHGPVLGVLGLAGLLGLIVAAVRRARRGTDPRRGGGVLESSRRLELLLVLVFVVAYSILYSLSTTNPSAHNWLPLTPFVALGAAWLLVLAGRALASRLPVPVRRPALALAVAAGVLALVVPANVYAYERVVPTTSELVRRHLLGALPEAPGRMVFAETLPIGEPLVVRKGGRKIFVHTADLTTLEGDRLALADAEVFEQRRQQEDTFLRRLAASEPSTVKRMSPGWFRARGEPMVVLSHPWRRYAAPVTLELTSLGPRRMAVTLPAEWPPEVAVSLELEVPDRVRGQRFELRGLSLGGRQLVLGSTGRLRGRTRYGTERFRPTAADDPVVLQVHGTPPRGLEPVVRAYPWTDPAADRSRP